jgi:hypothetical protein
MINIFSSRNEFGLLVRLALTGPEKRCFLVVLILLFSSGRVQNIDSFCVVTREAGEAENGSGCAGQAIVRLRIL